MLATPLDELRLIDCPEEEDTTSERGFLAEGQTPGTSRSDDPEVRLMG